MTDYTQDGDDRKETSEGEGKYHEMEDNKLLGDHGNSCVLRRFGGAAELARLQGNVEGLVRLGYPAYFVTIIGFGRYLEPLPY